MAKSEQHRADSAEEVDAAAREPQMVGDRMVRSSNDVNQGTTADGQRIGRGQSPRSSQEAGNDRGAKGGRNVVWINWQHVSQKGLGSAARLFRPDAPEYRAYQRRSDSQWTAWQSGERGESLRGWCDSSQAWSRVPEPVHRYAMNWKAGCRKSARPVWVGGDGGIRSLSTSNTQFGARGTTRPTSSKIKRAADQS